MEKGVHILGKTKGLFKKLPFGKNHGHKFTNRKKRIIITVSILFVIVILLVGFISYSSLSDDSLTGLVTRKDTQKPLKIEGGIIDPNIDALDQENKNMPKEVNKLESEISRLQSAFDSKIAELDTFRDSLSSQSRELSDAIDELKNFKNEQDNYKNENDALKDAMKSAVRSLCCSLNDIQENVETDWDIQDGLIICNGGHSLNCGSGNSDYIDSQSSDSSDDDSEENDEEE